MTDTISDVDDVPERDGRALQQLGEPGHGVMAALRARRRRRATTCTISAHAMHADDVRAGEDRGGHGGGGRPVALVRPAAVRSAAVRNDLREGPTSSGRPSAGKPIELRPARSSCVRPVFAKPKPGSMTRRSQRHAVTDGALDAALQLARHVMRRHRRSRASHTCRASVRACASARAPRRARATTAPEARHHTPAH